MTKDYHDTHGPLGRIRRDIRDQKHALTHGKTDPRTAVFNCLMLMEDFANYLYSQENLTEDT